MRFLQFFEIFLEFAIYLYCETSGSAKICCKEDTFLSHVTHAHFKKLTEQVNVFVCEIRLKGRNVAVSIGLCLKE